MLTSNKSYLTAVYSIFPHYLLTDMIIRRNVFGHNMCFDFLHKFLWNISCYKTSWARVNHKYPSVFTSNSRFSCQIYSQLEFPWQMFEKYSNVKFHEIPSAVSSIVPWYRRTYRHYKANCRFSQFDAPNKEPFMSICNQRTQVGNFAEPRPLAAALNWADGKQRNRIFVTCFETSIMETELNRDKHLV
jgi:hypothetical protein